MRQKINILFLGGGKRVSLLERFAEAGFNENLDIKFYCYELSDKVHLGDRATIIKGKPFTDFTVADLDAVASEHKVDIILPLMDAAVPTCARLKEQSLDYYIPVPDYEVAYACYDKLAFEEWVKNNKLDYLYPTFKKYPGFAKSRFGYGSRDQHIVRRKKDLKEGYVIQDLLDGLEYTVDCYVDQRGRLLGAVPRQRLLVVRGEVENSVTMEDRWFFRTCQRILQGTGFSGPVTVQFMEKAGLRYLTEINARFGGGVINSIEAGADYPRLMLREYLKKPVGTVVYEPNLLMLRSHRETFYKGYENT